MRRFRITYREADGSKHCFDTKAPTGYEAVEALRNQGVEFKQMIDMDEIPEPPQYYGPPPMPLPPGSGVSVYVDNDATTDYVTNTGPFHPCLGAAGPWREPVHAGRLEKPKCQHEWKKDTYFMSRTVYETCTKCQAKKEDVDGKRAV